MMWRPLAILTLAFSVAACAGDATAPAGEDVDALLEEMAGLAWSVTQVADGGIGHGLMQRLAGLPADIALSADQRARIGALIEAFVAATAADRAALTAIREEAADARRDGATPEQVRAILATGAEPRKRLHEATIALQRAVLAELTPAQRAWLANRPPPEPRPCALSDTQRTEISGLLAAYEAANAADIALIRAVHERARAAKDAGATRAEVAAILAEGREAVQRLRAARDALREGIRAVLTPEQLAAGCFRQG
jgi:Spy/CpxP family protein refolding chaperone